MKAGSISFNHSKRGALFPHQSSHLGTKKGHLILKERERKIYIYIYYIYILYNGKPHHPLKQKQSIMFVHILARIFTKKTVAGSPECGRQEAK